MTSKKAFRNGDTIHFEDADGIWQEMTAAPIGDYSFTVGNIGWYRNSSGVWHRNGLLDS